MRNTICPSFLSAMPAAWQNVIASATEYSDNKGGGNTASYVTSTSDKIWLLSEFELFDSYSYTNSAEQNYQKQYDYYKNGNSRVKYQHNATTDTCWWWLRSVDNVSPMPFLYVSYSGNNGGNFNADSSLGFSPCFRVA